ncbi:hypothetical protein ACHAPT_009405 [Fusarium lateritium]
MEPAHNTTSDEPSQPDDAPAAVDAQDEDDEDMADADIASLDAEILTPQDDKVREKFLDCVSELLSHTKGGKFVTAAALREKEDSIEIDLVRNDGRATKIALIQMSQNIATPSSKTRSTIAQAVSISASKRQAKCSRVHPFAL